VSSCWRARRRLKCIQDVKNSHLTTIHIVELKREVVVWARPWRTERMAPNDKAGSARQCLPRQPHAICDPRLLSNWHSMA
jgi:hypothetical protein